MLVEVEPSHFGGHETGAVLHALLVGDRIGPVEGEVELEVREFLLDGPVILEVEGLGEAAGAVEEGNLALGLHGMEEVHDVAAERGHAGAAAHEHVLGLDWVVFRQEEVPEGAADGDLVAGMPGVHVRGGYARVDGKELVAALRCIAVERGSGDTHVELDHLPLGGIVGHGVGAYRVFRVDALEVEETVVLPGGPVWLVDIYVLVVEGTLGDVYLDVLAALEVEVLAVRDADGELLDEGCDVVVADYLALEFLDAEGAVWDADLEVFLDLDLAAQAHAFLDLLAVEMGLFGVEYLSAAFDHLHLALAAVGLAAAGGGEEDAFFRKGVHDVAALLDVEHLLAVVDVYLYGPRRRDLVFHDQQEYHQDEGDQDRDNDCADNC